MVYTTSTLNTTYLRVPEMGGHVIALAAELECDDLVHLGDSTGQYVGLVEGGDRRTKPYKWR